MKKNKFMRLASVMLMLCLITTCAISGTFAKYTTSAQATDSARVAKWGVTVTMMAGETIFNDMYGAGDVAVDSDPNVAGINVSTPVDVVAPGTKGTLSTIVITGTPEVTVDVTTNLKLNLTNWNVTWDHDGDPGTVEIVYCPIVFTVGGETYGMAGIKAMNYDEDDPTTYLDHEYETVALLEEAIINAILEEVYDNFDDIDTGDSGYEIKKVARYNPNLMVNVNETFSWEWAFDKNVDAKDTALGNQAANATAPEIDFAMSVLIEQVD